MICLMCLYVVLVMICGVVCMFVNVCLCVPVVFQYVCFVCDVLCVVECVVLLFVFV